MSKLDEVLAQTSWAGKEQSSKIDQALSKTSWGEPATDSNIFYEDGKLMKSDLKTGTNATTIRDYMIDRFGQDYRYNGKINDNDMVEDFFNHMRSFNTNLLQTAGEVRYVSKADDAQKARADAAFRLYDQTGNVFVNDGFFGAIDGIGDYIKAAASDPSNYIGLLTGGLAKAGGLGASAGAKMTVRQALKQASKEAMKDEATQQGMSKAGLAAQRKVIGHMAANGVKSKASQKLSEDIAKKEALLFRKEMIRKAQREALSDIRKQQGRKAIMATTAIDGTLAALNDYQIQSVYGEIRPEYQYSVGQTAFSSLFGTVAGGAQLVGGAFKGASRLEDSGDAFRIARERAENMNRADTQIAKETSVLTERQKKQAQTTIKDSVKSWAEKVQQKQTQFGETTRLPTELLTDMLLGPNGNGKGGGIVSFYNKAVAEGAVGGLNRNHRVSDVLTNVVKDMPESELLEINKALEPLGFKLGDLTGIKDSLGSLIAGASSEAGQTLNAFSQAQRLINGTLLRADDVAAGMAEGVMLREADKAKRLKGAQYGQNLWRRMLVSSVSTTAVNVAGFSQYYIASTLADILSGGAMIIGGVVTPGAKGAEMRRVGKVYMNTVAEKARHLMDPFTTHDQYMKFLSENKDVSKVLFETVTGGVERTAARYGIDDTKKWYQVSEAVANGAAKLTGVRIQDSFTKSQMFMTEMDKYMKIKHNMSFADALKQGKTDLIDNDVIGSALDGTMKSVYSKDYTTDDQLLSAVAKQVEEFSNLPLIGTILPFGRFMNNTVATAYQWSVGGAVEVMSAIVKKEKRNISTVEAAARSIVGVTGLGLAMKFDEENAAEDRPYYLIDSGGGDLIDVKNLFPFSLFAAVGRMANLQRKGEYVPPEIKKDVLAQLAVGQFASDVQFGNDLYNVFDVFTSGDEGARAASLDALYQKSGSILAGFTRPLDALNKMAGFINNSDAARDPRQATGATRMGLEATKYLDNIVEMFTDKLDSVTGEELRVALREGSLQEPNPLKRIFGIKVAPARTAGEIVYSIAEMHPYMANMRTKVPEYDRIFNVMIEPILDRKAKELMSDPNFMNGTLDEQRSRVDAMERELRNDLNKLMLDYGDEKTATSRLRVKLHGLGSKEQKYRAKEFMKEQGVEGPMTEWTWEQLRMYEDFIELDREYGS